MTCTNCLGEYQEKDVQLYPYQDWHFAVCLGCMGALIMRQIGNNPPRAAFKKEKQPDATGAVT